MIKDLYWQLFRAFLADPTSAPTRELLDELVSLTSNVVYALRADAVAIDMVPREHYLVDGRALHARLAEHQLFVEARGADEDARVLLILWPGRPSRQAYAEDGEADIALEGLGREEQR